MGAGGGSAERYPGGYIVGTAETVLHTFTVGERSMVSVVLPRLNVTSTVRWSAPAPTVDIRQVGVTPNWGVNAFRASVFVSTASASPVGDRAVDNENLSISVVLPPGEYEIAANARNADRTYFLSYLLLSTVPVAAPSRYVASGAITGPLTLDRATPVTVHTHTVATGGLTVLRADLTWTVSSTTHETRILLNGAVLATGVPPSSGVTGVATTAEIYIFPGDVVEIVAISQSFGTRIMSGGLWSMS